MSSNQFDRAEKTVADARDALSAWEQIDQPEDAASGPGYEKLLSAARVLATALRATSAELDDMRVTYEDSLLNEGM